MLSNYILILITISNEFTAANDNNLGASIEF